MEFLETEQLGQKLTAKELKANYKQIYGGVAWPGKNPGFTVVIGMGHNKRFDNYDIFLLDEFETSDTRVLVRQCGVLDYIYRPKMWIGDNKNDAADRFISEMNNKSGSHEESPEHRRWFYVHSTKILDMLCPFQYIIPELKRLLDKDSRQLFLKDSKILNYLAAIEAENMASIEFGDFPAIEALSFAADG